MSITTSHVVHIGDSANMSAVSSDSVDLILTSPPYPMIAMWDQLWQQQNPAIESALEQNNAWLAFELMHEILDSVWAESYRVLKSGGIACINIGDATRTIAGEFRLFPNHARILSALIKLGLNPLPLILWRKPTNAPNKFMGSGVLPAGAYVTLEHEYILILRKGSKRSFPRGRQHERRRHSAFFWEERNQWFSDIWFDLLGAIQFMEETTVRKRSGAFPFELAYRLINMYSVTGDIVLDPFVGSGTTAAAALASARNSIVYELEPELKSMIENRLVQSVKIGKQRLEQRLAAHNRFVTERQAAGKPIKHKHEQYGYSVITSQETDQCFYYPRSIHTDNGSEFLAYYDEITSDIYVKKT